MISRNVPTVLKFIALPDLQHSGRLVQHARKMPMRLAAIEERIALWKAALRLLPIMMQTPLVSRVSIVVDPGSMASVVLPVRQAGRRKDRPQYLRKPGRSNTSAHQ